MQDSRHHWAERWVADDTDAPTRMGRANHRLSSWATKTAWAAAYARNYQGRSAFMRAMQVKAQHDPNWVPSWEQTKVILRIAEGKRRS